jgi:serine protease Do
LNRPNLRLVGARCARDVRFALARRLAPAFGGLLLLTAAAAAQAKPAPEGFADLAQKLLPAVVNISTTQTLKERAGPPGSPQQRPGPDIPQFPPGSPFEEFFKDFFDRNVPRGQRPEAQPRRATSLGSGFIIDASGLVVTNNHVIADADEINVILHDDTTLKAEVVGKDPKTDVALLRVKSDKPLSAVQLGDSDQIRVGDWVLAIGNPFGLGGTVTAGILSAHHRDIGAGSYDDFLQTDASINKGNSGGPMFNMNGEVIGINTAIYSPMATGGSVGIGFAIPSNLAKPVLVQLKDFGKARRGWLGVRIQGVTDEIAESLGLDKPKGALVASVSDKGPAAVAGIQPGDVVLTFDGKDVTDMRRLPRIVAETPIDKSVKVTVWRKKKEQNVDVKVGELQENEQQAAVSPSQQSPATTPGATIKALGLSLANATPDLKQKFSLADETAGVIVVEVANDSPAMEKGIRPGDVIIEVAQEEVKDSAKVAAKIDEARKAGRKSILLLVDRAGDLRFVALRIDQG